MKKIVSPPPQQDAECPHCHARQAEAIGAISTNCKKCGKYFKLDPQRRERAVHAPKETREVFCVKCGAPNIVSTTALSTQCIRCLHYLELGDKVVRGVQTGKLYAYDDVVFAEGCSFKGMEATGRRIEVRGKVFSKLRATAEIVALAGAQLSGELHAPVIRIERDAKVKVQTIDCARLMVSGEVEVTSMLVATEIIFRDGAVFSGQLNMPEGKLKIEAGVTTQMESITCREIAIEGRVSLGNSLLAEKVTVEAGGVLTSGRINAAQVNVSPGGFLQGRIEKYVPYESPAESPSAAEAA
jgi:cytoskeletal protein CcmA (bactofilin family)/ribosomal protein L40E